MLLYRIDNLYTGNNVKILDVLVVDIILLSYYNTYIRYKGGIYLWFLQSLDRPYQERQHWLIV